MHTCMHPPSPPPSVNNRMYQNNEERYRWVFWPNKSAAVSRVTGGCQINHQHYHQLHVVARSFTSIISITSHRWLKDHSPALSPITSGCHNWWITSHRWLPKLMNHQQYHQWQVAVRTDESLVTGGCQNWWITSSITSHRWLSELMNHQRQVAVRTDESPAVSPVTSGCKMSHQQKQQLKNDSSTVKVSP